MNNIFRIFRTNSVELFLRSYVTFVRPVLESSPEIWNPTLAGLTIMIEAVQRGFTRRIMKRAGLPYLPYSERLSFLGIDSLEYRRYRRDLEFIFKSVRGLVKYNTEDTFTISPTNRNLRGTHNSRLALPFQIYGIRRSTAVSRTLAVWNSLPNEAVAAPSFTSFCSRIKKLPHSQIVNNSFVHD